MPKHSARCPIQGVETVLDIWMAAHLIENKKSSIAVLQIAVEVHIGARCIPWLGLRPQDRARVSIQGEDAVFTCGHIDPAIRVDGIGSDAIA
ncbi:MAG: hypothetical protein D6790_17265 [Caldilineae bacterium]|nr:MAG: hypothetical protein D6790_17265 [Caldilineae bacterium]